MASEFNKLNLKTIAIIIGFLTYVVTTIVCTIGIIAADAIYADYFHDSTEPFENIPLMIISLIIDLLCVMLSGYVAGIIAKGYEIQNAIATGIPMIIYAMLYLGTELPFWFQFLIIILLFPFIYQGGVLAQQHNSDNPD